MLATATTAKTGSSSMRVLTTDTNSGFRAPKPQSVVPGTGYEFSFWITAGSPMDVTIGWTESSDGKGLQTTATRSARVHYPGGGVWQLVSLSATTGVTGGYLKAWARLSLAAAAFVDTAQLIPAAPSQAPIYTISSLDRGSRIRV